MNLPAGDRRVNARGQESQRYRLSRDVCLASTRILRAASLQSASVACRYVVGFAPDEENGTISIGVPSME